MVFFLLILPFFNRNDEYTAWSVLLIRPLLKYTFEWSNNTLCYDVCLCLSSKIVGDDRIWSSSSSSYLWARCRSNLSLIINYLRLFSLVFNGYDEYTAWSVLLIRPHVRGDELKIQAPDPSIYYNDITV